VLSSNLRFGPLSSIPIRKLPIASQIPFSWPGHSPYRSLCYLHRSILPGLSLVCSHSARDYLAGPSNVPDYLPPFVTPPRPSIGKSRRFMVFFISSPRFLFLLSKCQEALLFARLPEITNHEVFLASPFFLCIGLSLLEYSSLFRSGFRCAPSTVYEHTQCSTFTAAKVRSFFPFFVNYLTSFLSFHVALFPITPVTIFSPHARPFRYIIIPGWIA